MQKGGYLGQNQSDSVGLQLLNPAGYLQIDRWPCSSDDSSSDGAQLTLQEQQKDPMQPPEGQEGDLKGSDGWRIPDAPPRATPSRIRSAQREGLCVGRAHATQPAHGARRSITLTLPGGWGGQWGAAADAHGT